MITLYDNLGFSAHINPQPKRACLMQSTSEACSQASLI